ncbi:hypothetical protein D3C75_904570 [compost metagenome]
MPETVGIDYCNHGVEPGQRGKIDIQLRIGIGERLGDRYRLADAGGLDQNIIEPPVCRQSMDLTQQVITQGAANAAIRHFNQLLLCPGKRVAGFHQARIHIHLAHVINNHGHLQAVAVVQNVVEQCGFA